MASICCSPPESEPASCSQRSAKRGKIVPTRPRLWARLARPRRKLPSSRFSRTVRLGKMRRPSGTWIRPSSTTRAGLAAWMSSPSNRTLPAVCGVMRDKTLLSVDLPAPLLPSRATISPRPTSRLTPLRIWITPYPAQRSRTSSTGAPALQPRRGAVAQIGLDHARVGRDRRRRAVGDDAAVAQHVDALRETRPPPASRARSAELPRLLHGSRAPCRRLPRPRMG